MMHVKERIKFVFLNFIIFYSLGFFIFLLIYILFRSRLMNTDYYISMFLMPAVMSFFRCIYIWFNTKYTVIDLEYNSENNLKKIAAFSNSNRIKKITSSKNEDIYKINSPYSFLPIKLKIRRTESSCIITAPKMIIKELLGEEFEV